MEVEQTRRVKNGPPHDGHDEVVVKNAVEAVVGSASFVRVFLGEHTMLQVLGLRSQFMLRRRNHEVVFWTFVQKSV